MTKRTVLLLALAATTGVPAMAACSTAESQAPLPPQAAGPAAYPSSSSTSPNGTSVPLTADGQAVPSSGTVGANVAPGTPDASGGLRSRPGYAPGSASSATAAPDGYRVGARAPWGILLDDQPDPAPVPGPMPTRPHQTGDGRQDDQQPIRPALPEPPSGGGITILADGAGPGAAPVKVQLGNGIPPGQAKKMGDAGPAFDPPGQGLPSAVSLPALVAALPPVATPSTPADTSTVADTKPGKGPKDKGSDAGNGQSDATGPESATTNSTEQPGTDPQSQNPVSGVVNQVLQPSPTATPTPASQPQPASPQPSTPAPVGTGWSIDGIALQNAAPAATGNAGSPKFRKALRAALAARPDGQRPGPAALRRWSTALQKAAALAPDAQTKAQLRTLARYAKELAGTPAPKRSALQAKRPGALDAASALRANLPARFGVNLLG